MKFSTVICGVSALFLAASCLDGGSFKSNYNEYCSFEFSDVSTLYGNDSLYFETDFPQSSNNQSLAFRGKRNGEEKITDIHDFRGGFLLSLLRDTLVCEGHISENPSRSMYSTVADTTGSENSKGFAVFQYLLFFAVPFPAEGQ